MANFGYVLGNKFIQTAREIAAKWFNEHTEKWYKDELLLVADDIDVETFSVAMNNWTATLTVPNKPTRSDWVLRISMDGNDLNVYIEAYKQQSIEVVNLSEYGYSK